ncbi:outer membrane lipoprotein carrier protein LolA [Prosthecobacter sp.]|uniref:LolA family protein n=1 Tax=Prosthecobacter sp. TaxID=1965333 RepID=UPI002ABB2CE1|nr:outer membrane lipoprotein carrier protein LolA [Prosthecobacter sp.]MDZ4401524.1 outer membrane lipoprotein carrier protein LolA [Prosthecobacter sp.]
MNVIRPHLILALLVLPTLTVLAAPEAAVIPPVFRDWIAAQKDSGSIKVTFQQTRTTPALKEPVSASGRFWRMADGRFRWELGSPATTILVFDKETVRLKENASAPWQTLKPDDSRVRMWMKFLSGREMDAESLTKNFTLKITQQEKTFVTVAMIPRPLLIKKYLTQLDMQIEPGGKRLLGFRIVQGDGSTLLMNFGPPEKAGAEVENLFRAQAQ